MTKPKVTPVTKDIIVRYSNKNVRLPKNIKKNIDKYWEKLISEKPYKRGEVFTVVKKDIADKSINILVEKTDYAHYLYCQNKTNLKKNNVHIIHTAAIVETSDNYTILGEMGDQTSRSGIHQLCGGGIDNDDLKGKYFDFTHNIYKELQEELNINIKSKSRTKYFDEAYLKEGGPTDKMTVIYRVILNETKNVFQEKYDKFVKQLKEKDELPEFKKLIYLKNNKDTIERFFSKKDIEFDEYMKPLFNVLANNLKHRKKDNKLSQ